MAKRKPAPAGAAGLSLTRRVTMAGMSAALLAVILFSGLPRDREAVVPAGATPVQVAVYGYQVVNTYPHDAEAFTQGLIYRDGFLYEGTGLNGRSSLRKVRLETGEVVERFDLADQYFGEGITDWGSRLLQLTYRSNLGFVYDLTTFSVTGTFQYDGEGWGLTHDATTLIMSDGTADLRFFDPNSYEELGRVTVRDGGTPVESLNELEYVGGEVFANVWQTDRVAIIVPATGQVIGWIDLRGLLTDAGERGADAVLNGIAYDAAADRLFVTGKLWPKLFEIKLVRR